MRYFLSGLPLPSIRPSSKSNANNNSFKKHWGHLRSFSSGSVFCQNFGRGCETAIISRHGEGQTGKSSLARNRKTKNQYCSLKTGRFCLAKNKTILNFSGGDPIQKGSSWHAGQILPQDGNSTGGLHWKQPSH